MAVFVVCRCGNWEPSGEPTGWDGQGNVITRDNYFCRNCGDARPTESHPKYGECHLFVEHGGACYCSTGLPGKCPLTLGAS